MGHLGFWSLSCHRREEEGKEGGRREEGRKEGRTASYEHEMLQEKGGGEGWRKEGGGRERGERWDRGA